VKGENEDEGRVLAYKGGEKRVQKGRNKEKKEKHKRSIWMVRWEGEYGPGSE